MSWEDALKGVPPSALNSSLADYAFLTFCPPVQLNSLCGCYVWVSPISWSPNTDPPSPPNPAHHPPPPPALLVHLGNLWTPLHIKSAVYVGLGVAHGAAGVSFCLLVVSKPPETQQLPSPLLCPGPQGMS